MFIRVSYYSGVRETFFFRRKEVNNSLFAHFLTSYQPHANKNKFNASYFFCILKYVGGGGVIVRLAEVGRRKSLPQRYSI